MTKVPLPHSLSAVATLFIISGVSSAVSMLLRLLSGEIFINFGVLALFVGIGLFRLSRGWRTTGLVLLWIAIIVLPIVLLLALLGLGTIHAPAALGELGKVIAILLVAALYALILWMYRVLTRPDVRALFGLEDDSPSAGAGEA